MLGLDRVKLLIVEDHICEHFFLLLVMVLNLLGRLH